MTRMGAQGGRRQSGENKNDNKLCTLSRVHACQQAYRYAEKQVETYRCSSKKEKDSVLQFSGKRMG